LIEARHPLLVESLRASGDPLCLYPFSLDGENTAMVISEPTRRQDGCTETAGLLSLMGAVWLACAGEERPLSLLRSVLADIGDHQSLAANLSTFTSHAANISA